MNSAILQYAKLQKNPERRYNVRDFYGIVRLYPRRYYLFSTLTVDPSVLRTM